MKKWWKESALRQQENGMEAIEGLLVITLMLFVLFYIWAFGFLMYQNWAVQYVATDTASPYCADVWVLEFGPDYWLYQSCDESQPQSIQI